MKNEVKGPIESADPVRNEIVDRQRNSSEARRFAAVSENIELRYAERNEYAAAAEYWKTWFLRAFGVLMAIVAAHALYWLRATA